jgi:phosphoesterase RecJ-like protein
MKDRVLAIIREGSKFLVTTHVDADGDAIGSCFAFCFALRGMGKRAVIYLQEEVPYQYSFLPRPSPIVSKLPEEEFDAAFVLDCAKLSRVGDGYQALKGKAPIVNIDHHTESEPFGLLNLIDESASSTAEMLYFLFEEMGVGITYEIALNLYTAILTETGSFRFENTSEGAFFVCRELVRRGVDPSFVARMVYESHPVERFHLLSLVLSTLSLYKDGKVSLAYLTQHMLRKVNARKEYSDGFVDYLKEIKGVEVAIFVREIGEGRHKVSMRSRGNIDVARILSRFGGGGHTNAAGCVMEGDLEDVKERILEAVTI